MNQTSGAISSSSVYFRLIALWVLCETVLGGIIHGFKLPVSGLIVGSGALICICLLALYVPAKGAILKATIIVAIFKMMLSPQAPLPAYVAVFFQGIMGEIIFLKRKNYALGCMVLCVLGLFESSCQRIIIMTLVYGNDFWKVVNEFANTLVSTSSINYSLYAVGLYVLLHIIAGIFVGIYAASFPPRLAKWTTNDEYIISAKERATAGTTFDMPLSNKKKKIKWGLLCIWIALVFLYAYFTFIQPSAFFSQSIIQIIIRSALILLTWYLVIGPLLSNFMKNILAKQQGRFQQDVHAILQLLPSTKYILSRSWQLSSSAHGLKRIRIFCNIVLLNTLHEEA